jgi:hypothetical protein
VIDRDLRDAAWNLPGGRYVYDRRLGERRSRFGVGGRRCAERRSRVAPFVTRDADHLMLRYVCPRCGTLHHVPFDRGFARSYAAALVDRDCLCPGRTNWFVSHGISPRPVLVAALAALWLLNLGDLLLTHRALQSGMAAEANAMMGFLLGLGWLPAILFKVGVVSAGVLVLWRYRHHRLALNSALALTLFYSCVVLYQAVFIARLS